MKGASRWLEASAGAPAAVASATVRLAAKSLSPRLLNGVVSMAITPRLIVDRYRRLGRWRVRATELPRRTCVDRAVDTCTGPVVLWMQSQPVGKQSRCLASEGAGRPATSRRLGLAWRGSTV